MTPSSSIAHYRVTSKLGEGGMGAVYRATDTKLHREVAIKVLPDAFANDSDRMARFSREAQVLASLNHPNIAAIYGVEDRALVMELVDGQTLAERIAQGPIPLDDALPIAKQIAEALEYAHDKSVIHRDLKPANIKITPEGRVKVLDFGLAKALSNEPTAGDPKVSPTLTMSATLSGMIVGTAAYMSPEQARGQTVDRRADIWAFGVVLHEMLTGRQLFSAPTVSDTLASVLKGDLDLSAVPAEVRPILERCLRRDSRLRWRSIGDIFALLEEAPAVATPVLARRAATVWIAVAAVLAIALSIAGVGWWRATRPVEHPFTRLSVDLGPDALPGLSLTAAISPDGRRLVFPARGPDGKQWLATRLLDQAQMKLIPGSDGGYDPFFSADGKSIGFFASGNLRLVSAEGGGALSVTLGQRSVGGATWAEDGSIVASLANAQPLARIPAGGGAPRLITQLAAGENTHRWPQVLPGGGAVIFTASIATAALENASIQAFSMKTGQTKTLVRGGYYGRYVPTGHLIYVHQGGLYGMKFDPDRLEATGPSASLLDDVAANPVTGGGQFDFSATGTFVYAAGKSAFSAWQMVWLDQSGKTQPLIGAPGVYTYPRLSPDGRKLLYANGVDNFVYDVDRDTSTKLFIGGSQFYAWAPDNKHIAFSTDRGLFWIRADGAGDAQRLIEGKSFVRPWSIAPDGRVAYFERSPDTDTDIWTLPLDLHDPEHPKPGTPEPFLTTPYPESLPTFSPDGRWIAYRSTESGSAEIFVRPFPAASNGKWQISTGGGLYAAWSSNGRELFYEASDSRIMVVDYAVDGASFVPGKPRLWTDKPIFYAGTMNLSLAPDGKRFAVFSLPETAPGEKGSVHVTMLLNFFDEIRRRIP